MQPLCEARQAAKTMTKFYRTTFTIKVLSEEPLADCLSLSQIDCITNEGDCVGYDLTSTEEELAPADMAKALIEAGSEPGFFQLDDCTCDAGSSAGCPVHDEAVQS